MIREKYVRVHRISSYRDPDTGRLGKIIELVENVRSDSPAVTSISGEEASVMIMVRDILKTLPIPGLTTERLKPKITLYLTEEECEMLGIDFEVNSVYKIVFEDGSIKFYKADS